MKNLSLKLLSMALPLVFFFGCAGAQEVRILTLNVQNSLEDPDWDNPDWENCGRSRSGQICEIVRQTNANVVCLQEYLHNDRSIVDQFEKVTGRKWYYKPCPRNCAVISTFPILIHKDIFFQPVRVNESTVLYISSCHFHVGEYLPTELVHNPDKEAAMKKVYAENHNGYWFHVLDEIRMETRRNGYRNNMLCIGDFNEPSHLDYTKEAYERKLVPAYGLSGTTSMMMLDSLHFKDAYDEYRKMNDKTECEWRGFTYSPTTWYYEKGLSDTRLDFIYYRAPSLKLKECLLVGETPTHEIEGDHVDIQINPWPTDHRGFLTVFEVVK